MPRHAERPPIDHRVHAATLAPMPEPPPSAAKRAFIITFYFAVVATILLGCAGRLDLPWLWAWLVILGSAWLTTAVGMDADLVRERLRPGPGGTDRRLPILVLPFSVAHVALAGLDVGRFHWSDTVPLPLRIAGLVGLAASFAVSAWAVHVNRFFSSIVRVQTERGHVVISEGPYRFIRHPGYAALLVNLPCSTFVLGSWWSFAPAAVILLAVLRRTFIEDRFLHAHLAGYAEYAQRVRYRLVPGVW